MRTITDGNFDGKNLLATFGRVEGRRKLIPISFDVREVADELAAAMNDDMGEGVAAVVEFHGRFVVEVQGDELPSMSMPMYAEIEKTLRKAAR